ncbi:1-phosphatidylinositol-4,5-bisphosphate phosphodiesterase 1 [Scheffersomyces coipomensis]|uniref:1-phosphatidylinositol-4,5-bisphosphate phosphodiesterase 1 n=1 Tax=Scheffersomyces coipomensis TaxID=1788519 RepID=UPI00315C6DD0
MYKNRNVSDPSISSNDADDGSSQVLTPVVSPSDLASPLHQSTYVAHTYEKHRSNSSPVSSSLTLLFSNLRTNDGSNSEASSSQSGRSILKKLLYKNKSEEDLRSLSPPRSRTNSMGRRGSGSKSPIPFMNNTNGSIDSNDMELDPSIYASMGHHIKIPDVFIKDGLPLLKLSQKSKKRIMLKVDPTSFIFSWKSASSTSISASASNKFHKVVPNSIHTPKAKLHEFSLDNIKTIAYSKEATNYREELHISKEFESQWITIIYYNEAKKKLKTLHLIADTEHDLKRLVQAIKNLKVLRDHLAKELFIDAENINEDKIRSIMSLANHTEDTVDGNEKHHHVREFVSFSDILKYAKRLNINLSASYLKSIFNEVKNVSNSKDTVFEEGLNFNQFKLFISNLKKRNDIIEIWISICGDEQSKMSFEMFKNFMINIQKENLEIDQLQRIFKKFGNEKNDYWLPENFNSYLMSKYCQSLISIPNDINANNYFNHPLNEYFISSSHNTYLIGRQVGGESSVEGYIKALQRGCRCVEVDIWDGENDDSEPIVNHGRTFTVAISFTNVIKTLKKFAFVSSPYPLIISLEINCNANNQRKLGKILIDVLGDALVLHKLDDNAILPSPHQLKNKFLLKVKKTSPFNDLIPMDGSFMTASPSTASTTTTSFSEDNGVGGGNSGGFKMRRKKKGTKVIDDLSELGIYVQGLKFRNFSLPESKTFNHCFSLSEKSINSMLKDDTKKVAVDKHNRKYLMRIYPSGYRVSSSNFIPLKYWSNGAQMVATNWQTYDLGQQLNEAMFDGLQGTGYVLKPISLRKPLLKSMRESASKLKSTTYKFEITIISAHQLPKSKDDGAHAINPYITVDFYGATPFAESEDYKLATYKSSLILENGFNPIWNETFKGTITTESDLAFIKFTVNTVSGPYTEHDRGTPIGGLVFRLNYLKQGYRYLPIKDSFGEELVYSSLFVKINYCRIN